MSTAMTTIKKCMFLWEKSGLFTYKSKFRAEWSIWPFVRIWFSTLKHVGNSGRCWFIFKNQLPVTPFLLFRKEDSFVSVNLLGFCNNPRRLSIIILTP